VTVEECDGLATAAPWIPSYQAKYVAVVTPTANTAWAPLRSAVFRSLWLALLGSNVGIWMQTVGAQWMLVEQGSSATLISLVQTASVLPILFLALPAGALADSFDRRRMLIAVQCGTVVVGVVLTVLTAAGRMPPALLLGLTFALGAGQALSLPAWQAVVPDLVPGPQLASASALSGIAMNAARAVGPAIAGVLIAEVSVVLVFALNVLAFAVFTLVLWRWRREPGPEATSPERFTAALRAGGRYVRHAPVMRRVLLRAVLFVVPGGALWALLPLVASQRLGLGAGGYGVLLGALGVGAVAGAVVLPRLGDWQSANVLLAAAGVAYAVAMVALAVVPWPGLILIVLVFGGIAWVTVLATTTAAIMLILPGWVRARGLSIYQITFAAGLGLGSLAWGALAQATSLSTAYLAAAVVMVVGVATARSWPMPQVSHLRLEPAEFAPVPQLHLEPDPRDGPVMITVTYQVPDSDAESFVDAMQHVARTRRRTGAIQWGLFREGEREERFIEVYLVPSWDEHLRQHGVRLTGVDLEIQQRARAYARGDLEVRHLLPARPEK